MERFLDFKHHSAQDATLPPLDILRSDGDSKIKEGAQRAFAIVAPPTLCKTALHKELGPIRRSEAQAMSVRLLWCDTAGIRRCRVVAERRYTELQSCGLGVTTACMALPAYGDSPAANAGLTAVGEARLKPIDATRVPVPWHSGHELALVEFESPKDESPWDCCPRRALRNTCKLLLDKFGLTMKVGFELEFLLLERTPPGDGGLQESGWRPVDSALYCQSSALDHHARVLDDMVSALVAMGVEVVQWHAESAPGQFEIALMYDEPVASADKVLLAKEALVGVAGCHGLAVSFLPKPLPNAAGSGMHMHFSLWKGGKSLVHDYSHGMSFSSSEHEVVVAAITAAANMRLPGAPSGERPADAAPEELTKPPTGAVPSLDMLSFLGGVLAYMDALLPFTAPSPNSFERLRPGAWAGAHAAWGYNNREVPLRLTAPSPVRMDLMHVEYKALDGTANPYIAVAAVMVAGMLGLSAKLLPPEPCQVPPAELDSEAAQRLGVQLLPDSLRAALDRLRDTRTGKAFTAAMGEAISKPLLQAFLAVREAEARQAASDTPRDMLLRYS